MYQSFCPFSWIARVITFLSVFTFLGLTAAEAQKLRTLVPKDRDVFGVKSRKPSFCGVNPDTIKFSYIAPEYENYKLTGTFYSLDDGLRATLMFNNKGPESIHATPTFYSLAGTKLQLAPITVPATSYLEVDLHQLLANADEEFRQGSMKVDYQGGDYQLGAQVKLADPANKLIWAEQFIYTSKRFPIALKAFGICRLRAQPQSLSSRTPPIRLSQSP
jgi:hypothetical protein